MLCGGVDGWMGGVNGWMGGGLGRVVYLFLPQGPSQVNLPFFTLTREKGPVDS